VSNAQLEILQLHDTLLRSSNDLFFFPHFPNHTTILPPQGPLEAHGIKNLGTLSIHAIPHILPEYTEPLVALPHLRNPARQLLIGRVTPGHIAILVCLAPWSFPGTSRATQNHGRRARFSFHLLNPFHILLPHHDWLAEVMVPREFGGQIATEFFEIFMIAALVTGEDAVDR
jgi:hypothetical protein